MADIFLSYNEKDRATVNLLAPALQAIGWTVWWDRRIPAGMTWRAVLERELQDMRCMVVLWSASSVQSEWVYEEASEGRALGRLVPVAIDKVRAPAGFREIQSADLVGWDGSKDFVGLQHLVQDIERLIGKPAASATLANAPAVPALQASPSQKGARDLAGAADLGNSAWPQGLKRPVWMNGKPPWRAAGLAAVLSAVLIALVYLAIRPGQHSDALKDPAPAALGVPVPATLASAASASSAAGAAGAASAASAASAAGAAGATAAPPAVAGKVRPEPGTPPPALLANKPPATTPRPPAAARPGARAAARCAALVERVALGEILNGAERADFDSACRK